MAYSEEMADRVRALFADDPGVSERKMFGGLCVMVNGNMAFGVMENDLMVRVGPDAYEDALAEPNCRKMDFTGRPMKGMVFVDLAAVGSEEALAEWTARGAKFAGSLKPK
jgi:TfoX/Sxy family transcriptional regulator of competence genes